MIKVLVVDDSALMRKLLGQDLRDRSRTSRSSSRATGWRRSAAARRLQARRRHARHPYAADGRAGLPRPHHGRAALSGGDGLVADGRGRRGDPARRCAWAPSTSSPSPRARSRCTSTSCAPSWSPKVRAAARRQDQVERAAEGARPPPHRRRRHGRFVAPAATAAPRRMRRPRGAAKGWCWSEPRPAGRRRWRRC